MNKLSKHTLLTLSKGTLITLCQKFICNTQKASKHKKHTEVLHLTKAGLILTYLKLRTFNIPTHKNNKPDIIDLTEDEFDVKPNKKPRLPTIYDQPDFFSTQLKHLRV